MNGTCCEHETVRVATKTALMDEGCVGKCSQRTLGGGSGSKDDAKQSVDAGVVRVGGLTTLALRRKRKREKKRKNEKCVREVCKRRNESEKCVQNDLISKERFEKLRTK